MKTLQEIIQDNPWDHLMVIVATLFGIIYIVWALMFDPDKEIKSRNKTKNQ